MESNKVSSAPVDLPKGLMESTGADDTLLLSIVRLKQLSNRLEQQVIPKIAERIEEYKRKLKRHTHEKDILEKQQKGNEQKYTYWGGYEFGYRKGQIRVLEDVIDELT